MKNLNQKPPFPREIRPSLATGILTVSVRPVVPGTSLLVRLPGTPHAPTRQTDLESIPKTPALPLGEDWGEGKRSSESVEKTGSDSRHRQPRPLSRRPCQGNYGIGSNEKGGRGVFFQNGSEPRMRSSSDSLPFTGKLQSANRWRVQKPYGW